METMRRAIADVDPDLAAAQSGTVRQLVDYQQHNLVLAAKTLSWFAALVKIGAICGLSSVMLVLMYGQTRIFYTMARDGLIPPLFAKVHPKFRTPWINTLLVGLLVCGFAGFMGLDALADLTNVGTLVAFILVCATVIYLRYARPEIHRPFKTPLFPITPIWRSPLDSATA